MDTLLLDPPMKCPALSASGFFIPGNEIPRDIIRASSGIIIGRDTQEKKDDVVASILL
jgi:hypothetical protein